MKVIFTIDSLAQGGTEQSLAELIKHFSGELEVVVIYFYDAHQLKGLYQNLPCRLIYLDIRDKYGFSKAVKKLYSLTKIEKPDLVVSSLYRSLITSRIVCYLLGVPLVGTFVNLRYGAERKGLFKRLDFSKYFLTWLLDRLTSHIPDKIISNSYDIAVQNGKSLGIKREKIKVIYRGRDSHQISQWKFVQPIPVFKWVAIGRLIPQKGYFDLIAAISGLIIQGYSVQLEIIGEGPLHDILLKKIIDLQLEDVIHLKGNITNAWRELYNCNAFVLTSHSEGFSGALVEALMTGIPLVASDIPMNIEAVSPGKDAYIYKTGDINDLILKMKTLMENYDKACEVGKITRLRAIDNYDIRNIASIYEQTLKDIIRNNSK